MSVRQAVNTVRSSALNSHLFIISSSGENSQSSTQHNTLFFNIRRAFCTEVPYDIDLIGRSRNNSRAVCLAVVLSSAGLVLSFAKCRQFVSPKQIFVRLAHSFSEFGIRD